ncbi:MAG: energy-coupling factor transporter transmembrane protein EcfT [Coriobacteriia bacterium]|nr:energy-coupling factor transporter transmembrane protein EcfT [Coriobacteriia bacterium]
MAFDITIGQFHNTDSIMHRLDPRTKVTLLFVMIVAVFLTDTFLGLAVIAALLLTALLLSAVPPKTALKALAPLSFFLLFPLFLNLFFVSDGDTLLSWGPILITDVGLYQAGFMTLRLLLLFFTATLLTLCTSPIALCDATAAMLRPFRRLGVPAYEISMMISIALRFIPTLLDDFDHIVKAQKTRGAVFDRGGPIRRVKAIVPCLVPLFAQSFRHAEELAMAMESRCYHGGENRTHYHILRFAPRDGVASALSLAVLIVMLFWL